MSKTSGDRHHKKKKHTHKPPAKSAGGDHAVYVVLLLLGGFGLLLWGALSPETWRFAMIGYVLAIGGYVTHSVWLAYAGQDMPNWRQSLARLPLRFFGYGRKGGKPIAAAHDQPEAKTAMIVSIVGFLAIAGGLWAVFI